MLQRNPHTHTSIYLYVKDLSMEMKRNMVLLEESIFLFILKGQGLI